MITKLRAALRMTKLSPQGKVTKGQNVIDLMKVSPYFTEAGLPMPYESLAASLKKLNDAIQEAAKGMPGSTSHMHEQERIVLSVFGVIRSYVEMIANDTSDPKTIIESAGMAAVARSGNTPVTELTISPAGNGAVDVTVPRATGEVAFIYQYSEDGGINWLDLESSKLSTVQLKGRKPGSTLTFRYAAIGKTLGAYSQPKSAMVI